MFAVRDDKNRLESAQEPIRPPELREFDRRPGDVVRIVLELGFEPFDQSQAVGRTACKSDQDLTFEQLPHLGGFRLDDRGAERDLPVAPHGHLRPSTNRENRRRMPIHLVPHPSQSSRSSAASSRIRLGRKALSIMPGRSRRKGGRRFDCFGEVEIRPMSMLGKMLRRIGMIGTVGAVVKVKAACGDWTIERSEGRDAFS